MSGHPAVFDATTNLFIAERSRTQESGILIYSSETCHHLDRREKQETNHHAINCNCCTHLISSEGTKEAQFRSWPLLRLSNKEKGGA